MALLSRVEHESGLVRLWLYDDEADKEWFAELWPEGAADLAAELLTHAGQARDGVAGGIARLEASGG